MLFSSLLPSRPYSLQGSKARGHKILQETRQAKLLDNILLQAMPNIQKIPNFRSRLSEARKQALAGLNVDKH